MTKEELERQKWNDIFLEDCAVYDKKIAEEYTTLEEQIAKLKEENKEAKEIMKNWLQWANDDIGSPKFQDIVNKTEQFLRCCEI